MAETKPITHRSNFKDLTGQPFEYLVVRSLHHKINRPNGKGTKHYWLCDCKCGNTTIAEGSNLKSGNTLSCGCKKFESQNATHGETGTRLYHIWASMKARCNNPNNHAFATYGGRGIRVCDEWCQSYEVFREWASVNGYSELLTLDRYPDQNGNYEPGNCRWATWKQQQRNRRDTIMLEFRGQRKSLCDLADDFNIRRSLVYSRIIDLGWMVERALTTPAD